MEELRATINETAFRNAENGYTVLTVRAGRENVTVVGVMPEVAAGEQAVFQGEWVQHPQYGRQFKAASCEVLAPSTLLGIERYLASGLIRGVGAATARLIVQEFGLETMDILSQQPHRLSEVPGIGVKRAKQIGDSFREQYATRQAMIFLQAYGVTPGMAVKISKVYGERTREVIQQNPYRLVEDVEGVGFLTADRIALSMGVAPESDSRLSAGLIYALQEAAASAGHTYLPMDELLTLAGRLLRVEPQLLQTHLTALLLARKLRAHVMDGAEGVFLPQLWQAESEIARRLRDLQAASQTIMDGTVDAQIRNFEKAKGISFSPTQKKAISMAAQQGLLVITGGPGTGKTTIINCILSLLDSESVLLAAPTGRAAKRMSEATGEEAKTIHRLLEYGGDSGAFARSEDYPLECDCLIVDEMSMVDVTLMRGLMRAVLPGTRVILVGDADQLPSVGAGNVLKDILDSDVVPSIRLTDIFRQDESSMIVLNAHRINHGEMPVLRSRDTDFFFTRKVLQSEAAQAICDLLRSRLPKYLGFPREQWQAQATRCIQVLTPTKKGDCGAANLNRLLQETLNPERPGVDSLLHGETEYRVGDKVIQTKNDYQIEYTRQTPFGPEEGQGVFNGDVGYIERIDPAEHMMTVLFDDDRVVTYQKQQLDALDLAYSLTVHKSQGSEFPVVVMPVVGGPPMLMARNLLYTALTRARQLVVLVGREEVIQQMVENDHVAKRYTTLKDRLLAAAQLGPEA